MPRLLFAVPRYSRHKASGQAVVTIQGRDKYIGPYGSRSSKLEYDRLVGEWIAAGRPMHPTPAPDAITVIELIDRCCTFAEQHYVKDGQPTSERHCLSSALRPLRKLYSRTPAADFGPLALKAIQQVMVSDGLARPTINAHVSRIRRMFKWAVSEQLVPPAVFQGLVTVSGLRRGRSAARETKPIPPIDDSAVEMALPHLPTVVSDMVRFQRLTGCRPGEVCLLRPCDLDRSQAVWTYKPASHKTEHHGRPRVIFIGPKAQALLLPYLLRQAEAYCFTPVDSERRRHTEMRAARKSRVQPSQRDRSKVNAERKPGNRYTSQALLKAVWRACDAAFAPPNELPSDQLAAWRKQHRWSPNQLRHSAATEIRKRFGLEAAQVTLGHAYGDVTEIYAERDMTLASNVMQQVG